MEKAHRSIGSSVRASGGSRCGWGGLFRRRRARTPPRAPRGSAPPRTRRRSDAQRRHAHEARQVGAHVAPVDQAHAAEGRVAEHERATADAHLLVEQRRAVLGGVRRARRLGCRGRGTERRADERGGQGRSAVGAGGHARAVDTGGRVREIDHRVLRRTRRAARRGRSSSGSEGGLAERRSTVTVGIGSERGRRPRRRWMPWQVRRRGQRDHLGGGQRSRALLEPFAAVVPHEARGYARRRTSTRRGRSSGANTVKVAGQPARIGAGDLARLDPRAVLEVDVESEHGSGRRSTGRSVSTASVTCGRSGGVRAHPVASGRSRNARRSARLMGRPRHVVTREARRGLRAWRRPWSGNPVSSSGRSPRRASPWSTPPSRAHPRPRRTPRAGRRSTR